MLQHIKISVDRYKHTHTHTQNAHTHTERHTLTHTSSKTDMFRMHTTTQTCMYTDSPNQPWQWGDRWQWVWVCFGRGLSRTPGALYLDPSPLNQRCSSCPGTAAWKTTGTHTITITQTLSFTSITQQCFISHALLCPHFPTKRAFITYMVLNGISPVRRPKTKVT